VELIFKTEAGSPLVIDDYGRSPLSDAMWAILPSVAIIELLLDYAIDLLYLTDVRGFTPLDYIRKEHILQLCLFLYSKRENYWPLQEDDRPKKITKV
jgi:hypothetical protein